MRGVVQRVTEAQVSVDGKIVGRIDRGLVVLLGVAPEDGPEDVRYLVDKTVGLRIFEDDQERMNLSIREIGGAILAISQFTLLGDCRKGRRPSFVAAAPPEHANQLYERYIAEVRAQGVVVKTGTFRAMMQVHLVNDGPVTMLLDSRKAF
ncbi:MAG: D-aminoacyl-tRNA deacylase [Pirellulaceae bacterium]